jgi:hypothetical protein
LTSTQLKGARVRDVYRLAKWLGLEADKRPDESVKNYYRRLFVSVLQATGRPMWSEL